MLYKNKWRKTPMEKSEKPQCPNFKKMVMVGVNRDEKKAIMFNPRCKQWDCEYCQQLNADEWIYIGTRGAMILLSEGHEMQFVTLTSRGYATETKSLYFFSQNWPKFVRRMAYHNEKVTGDKLHYMLIPEKTKRGILHAHFMATTQLSKRWFKDNAHESGFGHQVEVKPMKDAVGASRYVTKYLGKDVVHTAWPKGFRRVRTSRNWPKSNPAELEVYEWSSHSDESAWFEYYLLQDYGYTVIDNRQSENVDN